MTLRVGGCGSRSIPRRGAWCTRLRGRCRPSEAQPGRRRRADGTLARTLAIRSQRWQEPSLVRTTGSVRRATPRSWCPPLQPGRGRQDGEARKAVSPINPPASAGFAGSQAVGLGSGFEDVGVVGDAVDDGSDQARVGKLNTTPSQVGRPAPTAAWSDGPDSGIGRSRQRHRSDGPDSGMVGRPRQRHRPPTAAWLGVPIVAWLGVPIVAWLGVPTAAWSGVAAVHERSFDQRRSRLAAAGCQ